jgi:hypothetical protein
VALHTALDIYGTCYDLLGVAGDVVLNMRRDAKRVYGDKIIDACIELDVHIRGANMAHDKEPHLLRLLERLEVIELIVRVCRDRRYIATGQYAELVKRTQSIGKQANGWRKDSSSGNQQRLFPDRQGDHDRASV